MAQRHNFLAGIYLENEKPRPGWQTGLQDAWRGPSPTGGKGIFALNDNAGNQNRREIPQQVAFPSSVLSSGRGRGPSLVGNRKSAACEGGMMSQRPSAQYQRGVL